MRWKGTRELITQTRRQVREVPFKKKKKKKEEEKGDAKKKHVADYTTLNHSGRSNLFEIRHYLGFATRATLALTTYLIFEQRRLKAASRNSPLIRLAARLIVVLANGTCDALAENIFGSTLNLWILRR